MADTTKVLDTAEVEKTEPSKSENHSLETLAFLINVDRLEYLRKQTEKELDELKTRQNHVRTLHKLIKAINAATDSKGNLDFTKDEELKKKIKEAKELGVELKDDKFKYTKEERDRLIENIRMSVEDFNVQNDMQIQSISRFTNERYESYQLTRNILKPLHEDKLNKARSSAGR